MQPPRQAAQAAEEYLDASWGSRLTQICALSRLNDELSKIKKKGKACSINTSM